MSLAILVTVWGIVLAWISIIIFMNKDHHPKALFYLFFVELWERFSYYGMRALLILYMTKELLFGDELAAGYYGAYVALVYATPIIGGFLAEKYLGSRIAISMGALLMMIGHFLMAVEVDIVFFIALSFLIIGNGFFKPNISTLVGKLYKDGDPKKDSAFTLFYMGINTGAFLAPLTCGFVSEYYGSAHYGFTMAGVGMLVGYIIFILGKSNNAYEDKGLPLIEKLNIGTWQIPTIKAEFVLTILAMFTVPIFLIFVIYNDYSKYILYLTGLSMLVYVFFLALSYDKTQKDRLFVVLILFVFTVLFWTFFELAGSAITLFTDRNILKTMEISSFTLKLETSQFQSINPFFIILLAPLFSMLWEKWNINIPTKFAIALLQLGAGFGILVYGAQHADQAGMVPMLFMVLAYLLHTTGELCISPIGLSLVTKLSPKNKVAIIMGVWLFSSSFAGLLGAEITKVTALPSEGGVQPPATESLWVYAKVFEYIAYVSVGAGLIMFALVKPVHRMMNGID